MVPSTIVVTLGSTDRNVRSVRTRAQDEDGNDRSEQAAAAAAKHDATQHHRRDAGQQIGPRGSARRYRCSW